MPLFLSLHRLGKRDTDERSIGDEVITL